MRRRILGIAAGLLVWFGVIGTVGVLLRAAWPAYVTASSDMSFTLPMKLTRLSIGAFATLAMGLVTAVATRSTRTALIAGVLMLLLFIPEHVRLWDKFPVWYHLTFLGSLVPLSVAGGRLTGRATNAG